MLRVLYGTFQELEDAFIARLTELRGGDLITPVAIVAPSRRMADRLQELAARRLARPLLGAQFHTFFSLARSITEQEGFGGRRLIGDPLFHSRLIDKLLEETPALGGHYGGGARPKAMASALRSSIRDLIDANVSGDDVLANLGELVESSGAANLLRLLELLQIYCRWLDRHEILVGSGLPLLAAEQAQASRYLAGFREILYYGFYDLTGRQLEFFEQVTGHYPAVCFFPFRKDHSAFRFSNDFFTLKLHREGTPAECAPKAGGALAPALDVLFSSAPPAQPVSKDALQVYSASGVYDEAWCVSKEILRLTSEGVDFSDIGVVSRTLEPYHAAIAEAFSADAIPYEILDGEPLKRHPLARTVLDLLTLKRRDFPAFMVADVLGSPYFRSNLLPRKIRENLPRFIEKLGISAGWVVWKAKVEASHPEFYELLLSVQNRLSESGKRDWTFWSDYTSKALDEFLRLPKDADAEERNVWDEIGELIGSLAAFEPLGPVDWDFFLDALIDKLQNAVIPAESRQGVRVMNAMDARGQTFRHLFVIGLQEGFFPRRIREDPLLRDADRRRLRHPGGYWLQEKMAGHEEERLLFYLLMSSATERVYCVYSRSDHEGKALTPSIYLRELCRASGLSLAAITRRVARQPLSRIQSIDAGSLSPKEVTLRWMSAHQDASGYQELIGRDGALLRDAPRRIRALNAGGTAGPLDGIVGEPKAYLSRLLKAGLSPRALDLFAQCPFQFFASKVLELKPEEDLVDRGEISALLKGTIYHHVLERFYRALKDQGYWSHPRAGGWLKTLTEAIDAVFAENDWRRIGLYPVSWKAARAAAEEALTAFVGWDMQRIASSGMIPSLLERDLRGPIPLPKLPESLRGLEFHGITDRVDLGDGRYQIVDYKSRWPSEAMHKQILAGKKNQMPIYAELIRSQLDAGRQSTMVGAPAYVVEGDDEGSAEGFVQEYPASQWNQDRKAVLEGISISIDEIAKGRFPIRPKDGEFGYCRYCSFDAVCRKSHGRSRVRADAAWSDSPVAKIHERKRQKT